jgi:hypothetical protein
LRTSALCPERVALVPARDRTNFYPIRIDTPGDEGRRSRVGECPHGYPAGVSSSRNGCVVAGATLHPGSSDRAGARRGGRHRRESERLKNCTILHERRVRECESASRRTSLILPAACRVARKKKPPPRPAGAHHWESKLLRQADVLGRASRPPGGHPSSPVGTTVAASTISTTVRVGARVRCKTPRGTRSP